MPKIFVCQKVLKVHPRNEIHWPKKGCLTTHHLNHLSLCHLQLPRINVSAPILWTHLHQNLCFHIHTQVHVVGLVIDHVAFLPLVNNTNSDRSFAKRKDIGSLALSDIKKTLSYSIPYPSASDVLLVLSAVTVDEHVFLLMLIRSGRNCLELGL